MWLASGITLGLGVSLFIIKHLLVNFHQNHPPIKNTPASDFAIIIPARDESKVIEDLFKSLEKQTEKVRPENVYVIVESPSDPTVALTEKYHYQTIIRSHPEKQRKGYALDEAVHAILKHKKFALYFIFDADNTLHPDFIKKMLKTYEKGYDIGIGCRRTKNPTTPVAVGSGLIFTIVNVLMNNTHSKHGFGCIASGTGYFISSKIIEPLGGFPFHTMTEDYELSLYAALHHYQTFYDKTAIFYDTQPKKYTQYFLQRARWEKGYFEARHLYFKRLIKKLPGTLVFLIGVYDFIFIALGLILSVIAITIGYGPIALLISLAIIYLILALFTVLLLHLEKYQLRPSLYLKTVLIHPLLLLTYIPCLFVVIFKRDLAWHRIEH